MKVVNIALLLGAFLYVLPIFEIAAAEAKWHRIEVWLGILSLWAIPILAFVLVAVILVAAVIGAFTKQPESKGDKPKPSAEFPFDNPPRLRDGCFSNGRTF